MQRIKIHSPRKKRRIDGLNYRIFHLKEKYGSVKMIIPDYKKVGYGLVSSDEGVCQSRGNRQFVGRGARAGPVQSVGHAAPVGSGKPSGRTLVQPQHAPPEPD